MTTKQTNWKLPIRLEKALKNVRPKERKIIMDEIAKLRKHDKAKYGYRNYSKGIKYNK